jgi:hypothetical protein
MATITIELTETQYKGLEYAALSPEDWAINAVETRAKLANDEIVQMTVQHCLDNGEQIPTTREEIVAHGFEHGVVKTAAVRQEEAEAEAAAMAAEQAAVAAEQAESTPTEGA